MVVSRRRSPKFSSYTTIALKHWQGFLSLRSIRHWLMMMISNNFHASEIIDSMCFRLSLDYCTHCLNNTKCAIFIWLCLLFTELRECAIRSSFNLLLFDAVGNLFAQNIPNKKGLCSIFSCKEFVAIRRRMNTTQDSSKKCILFIPFKKQAFSENISQNFSHLPYSDNLQAIYVISISQWKIHESVMSC